MAQQQEFTLAAFYEENGNRFVDSAHGENVTDALITMMKELHSEYGNSASELVICGVFIGGHEALDVSDNDSHERPKRTARPGAEKKPFTVVTDEDVHHVMAADAADAELDLEDVECFDVAAVFNGHLVDISEQVDWDRFYAETAVPEEEAA